MYHVFTCLIKVRRLRTALLLLWLSFTMHRAWSQAVPCNAARIAITGISCAGCKVLNASYAMDDNVISASSLVAAPGSVSTFVQQAFQFASNSNAGDSAYVFLSFPAAVSDPQALQSIQLSSYLNSAYNEDRQALTSGAFRIQWYTPEEALVSWAPAHPYNRVGVRLTAGATISVNLHYASSGVSKPHVLHDSLSICSGMAVNLQASNAPGTVINWYTQPYGGCAVYTGNTFPTPPLSNTTVYYAEASKGDCANKQRMPVTVTVLPGITEVTKQWDKTFGGSQGDVLFRVLSVSDSAYLLAGMSYSYDGDVTGVNNLENYWLLKVRSDGTKIWSKTYGGSKFDYLTAAVPTPDGAYLLCGRSTSTDGDVTGGNKGGEDAWIIKVDANGNKLWDKSLGGSHDDLLNDILVTSDGGYLLSGSTSSADGDISDGNNGSSDGWLVKLDANGNRQWDKTFGGSDIDNFTCLLATGDGGYLVGGYAASHDGDISDGNNGWYDYWIMKTDAHGNKLWDKTWGGSTVDYLYDMLPTSDGGFLLAGNTLSNNGDVRGDVRGNYDIWLIRIDAQGNKIWNRPYGGNAIEFLKHIIDAGDGNFMLAGTTQSDNLDVTDGNNGGTDWWIIKADSLGNILWDKTWGGGNYEGMGDIAITPTGGLVVAGYTSSSNGDVTGPPRGSSEGWVLKALIPTCTNPVRATAARLDTVPRVAAMAITKTAPGQQEILKVYPNPFRQQLSLRYTLQQAGQVSLQLYNMQGQPVLRLKEARLSAGTYQETINGSSLNSGTYICRMLLNGKQYAQTVIKL